MWALRHLEDLCKASRVEGVQVEVVAEEVEQGLVVDLQVALQ